MSEGMNDIIKQLVEVQNRLVEKQNIANELHAIKKRPLDGEWLELSLSERTKRTINSRRELRDYLASNHTLITVAGMVGLGKTTLTRVFAEDLNIHGIEELNGDNTLLNKFLADKKTYCVPLQRDLLAKRIAFRNQNFSSGKSCIEDRTPEEDPGMFYKLFVQDEILSPEDFSLLREEAIAAYKTTSKSQLMIILDGPPLLARTRILERGRPNEYSAWPMETLQKMSNLYQEFPQEVESLGLHQGPYINLDLTNFDIEKSSHLGWLYEKALHQLKEFRN